jgi:hypothetical protein
LQNEKFYNVYFSSNVIWMIKSRVANAATIRQIRNTHKITLKTSQGKRSLVRARRRCENSSEMDFRKYGEKALTSFYVAQERG